jgi:hypothetical protein
MSLACLSDTTIGAAHRQFEAALPQIERTLRYHFRRWHGPRRAELIADGRAAAWHAWHGLMQRGKDPLAVGPTGIAYNAARYVKAGRLFGCGTSKRDVIDLFDRRTRHRLKLKVVSLDRRDVTYEGGQSDAWRDWLAEDNRVSPADEAAFRIDFAAWLDRLPVRKRQIADLLAEGHQTIEVARLFAITPGAVSQTRAWLDANWRAFQGGPSAAN